MIYWIWLTQIPFIGPIAARKLIEYFENAENVYKAKEKYLEKIPGLSIKQKKNVIESENAKKKREKKRRLEVGNEKEMGKKNTHTKKKKWNFHFKQKGKQNPKTHRVVSFSPFCEVLCFFFPFSLSFFFLFCDGWAGR